MPFTLLHLGPGMGTKGLIPKHFSLLVFGMAQVAIDLEVLWHIVQRDFPLHRFFHTYVGATIIAGVIMVIGKPCSQWIKRIWNLIAAKCSDADVSVSTHTSWIASFAGAAIGVYSHILLDSVFHEDIEPLQPWSPSNALYGMMSQNAAIVLCVLAGIAGLALFVARERARRKAGKRVD